MKKFLNLAILFEKEPYKKLVANHIVHIAKDMMGSECLARMNVQYYYRSIRVTKMMLRQESAPALAESQSADNAESKSMGIPHSDDAGMYTMTMEDQWILISAAGKFIKNPNKQAPFYAPTFYSGTKLFWKS